jgi:hypothetical protein
LPGGMAGLRHQGPDLTLNGSVWPGVLATDGFTLGESLDGPTS